jgi:cytochrome c6
MIQKQILTKFWWVLAAALSAAGAGTTVKAADINKGGQLFSTHCANCHGSSGVPVMPGAPNFQRSERLLQPDFVLLASIRRGRNAMPAYAGILRDHEIMDLVAHLRTLQR